VNVSFGGTGGGGGGGGGGGTGVADVIVGAIPDVSRYGAATIGGVSFMAYAFGTTSCNIGTAQLEWFEQPDNRHPFIPMNMYRLGNGRFEQIGWYNLTLRGATIRQNAAIAAWRTADPSVQLEYVDAPGDGRFIVACKVTQSTNGTWHYGHAIQNLNSDRSGRSFTVPVPAGVTVTNAGFKDIDSHSGDPYSPTDWSIVVSGSAVTRTGGSYSVSPNGNALRFATLYNFRFDASTAPAAGTGAIGLFKRGAAGAPDSAAAPVKVPAAPANPADRNGDGSVNGADRGHLLGAWGTPGPGDLDGDGSVTGADLGLLLAAWS